MQVSSSEPVQTTGNSNVAYSKTSLQNTETKRNIQCMYGNLTNPHLMVDSLVARHQVGRLETMCSEGGVDAEKSALCPRQQYNTVFENKGNLMMPHSEHENIMSN